jgi:hypothetical protein
VIQLYSPYLKISLPDLSRFVYSRLASSVPALLRKSKKKKKLKHSRN